MLYVLSWPLSLWDETLIFFLLQNQNAIIRFALISNHVTWYKSVEENLPECVHRTADHHSLLECWAKPETLSRDQAN